MSVLGKRTRSAAASTPAAATRSSSRTGNCIGLEISHEDAARTSTRAKRRIAINEPNDENQNPFVVKRQDGGESGDEMDVDAVEPPKKKTRSGPQELEELFATAHAENIHAYRAVTISNVPKSATLHDVLSNIRAGKIFSVTLHETAGFRTNPPIETNTITLTFTSGKDTKDFITSCEANSNFALLTSSTTFEAEVTLIPTITRPLTPWVISKMKEDNLSRVLYIHDPEKTFPLDRVVEEMMRGGAKKPLKESFDDEVPGLMLFEFASIQEAANARGAMEKNFNFFGEISRGFAADPCAKPKGPVESGVELGEDGVEEMGGEAGVGGEELLGESEIEREEEVKMMEG